MFSLKEREAWIKEFFSGEEKKLQFVHFTHAEDADGMGCKELGNHFFWQNGYRLICIPLTYGNMAREINTFITLNKMPVEFLRVIITDLSVNQEIAEELEAAGIKFLWIDHHALPSALNGVIQDDPKFFIRNGEYTEREFKDYFNSEHVFDPSRYSTGTVKYSALPLFYVILKMLFKGTIFDHDLRRFEEILIEPLSDSDTYHFKYRTSTSTWVTFANSTDPEFHGKPRSMVRIPDVYTLIFKHQGKNSFAEIFSRIFDEYEGTTEERYGTTNDLESLPQVNLATVAHQHRIEQYSYFKNTCIKMRVFGTMGETRKPVAMMFTPAPGSDFSIFSSWLFEEDPELECTFGVFPESRTVSMRSVDNGISVASFCQLFFNGGGHAHAAGGKISPELFMDIMSAYYKCKMYGEYPRYGSIDLRVYNDADLIVTDVMIDN